MHPNQFHSDFVRGSRGFTLISSLASLAVIAAVAAVCVPLVARRLHNHASAVDDATRRVEAAVRRGLDNAGSLAEAYADSLHSLPRPLPNEGAGKAVLSDTSGAGSIDFKSTWDFPTDERLFLPTWRRQPEFWNRFCPAPQPWHHRRRAPLWHLGPRGR